MQPLGSTAEGDVAIGQIDPLAPTLRRETVDAAELAERATVKVLSRSCRSRTAGSGVLVSVDGTTVLVTNHHVVRGQSDVQKIVISVGAGRSEEVAVAVVAVDPGRDLAIGVPVERPGASLSDIGPLADVVVVPLADRQLEHGDSLSVSGFPGGRELAVVEATGQLVAPGASYGFEGEVALVNGAAVPGMSGGPVIAANGHLVAVVAAVDQTTGLVIGVPAAEIRRLVDQIEPGDVRSAGRGVASVC